MARHCERTGQTLNLAVMLILGVLLLPMAALVVAVGAQQAEEGVPLDSDQSDGSSTVLRASEENSLTMNSGVLPGHERFRGYQRRRNQRFNRYLHEEARHIPLQEQGQARKERRPRHGRRRAEDALDNVVAHNRVVGGSRAGIDQFPFFAHLLTKSSTGEIDYQNVCGGVLIAPSWVMTAAHCLHFPNTNILNPSIWGFDVGFYCRYSHNNCGQTSVWVALKRIEIRNYDASSFYLNDLALVELVEPVYNIPYARPDDGQWYNRTVPYQTQFTAMGRGFSDLSYDLSSFLEYASMTLIETSDCEARWGINGVVDLDGRVFCMAVQTGINTCNGDSGGPVVWRDGLNLVRDEDERAVVMGLVIGGDGNEIECAEANRRPTFFADVSGFYSYIEGMVCTGFPKPSWCPSFSFFILTDPPTPAPTSSCASCRQPQGHDHSKSDSKSDDVPDESKDDLEKDYNECNGLFDSRLGGFYPKLGESKVKTCKWLARKSNKKREKYCDQYWRSNAADVCPKTCCEASRR